MSSPNAIPPLDEIYRQLQKGAGHEWVNDENVQELIDMAVSNRHRLIEVQLREWRASCAPSGEDEEAIRDFIEGNDASAGDTGSRPSSSGPGH